MPSESVPEHRAAPCVEPVLPDHDQPVATADHSRMCQRVRRRYVDVMAVLPAGEPVRSSMLAALDALLDVTTMTGLH